MRCTIVFKLTIRSHMFAMDKCVQNAMPLHLHLQCEK